MSRARATRALRRNATTQAVAEAASSSATSSATFLSDFTCVPSRAFAYSSGGVHYVEVLFTIPVTAPGALTVADWTVNKSGSGQTITSVGAAGGVVTITMTGTPFDPINKSAPSYSVSYDGTDTTFVENACSGRAVAAFENFIVDPRFDVTNSEYTLMPEQSGAPSSPASGFVAFYADNAGNLKFKLSDGTVKTITAL